MYEDSWYGLVPETSSKRSATVAQPPTHRRSESLVQQPNGTGKADEISEPLENVYKNLQDVKTPTEPTLTRRAASYSDFYHVVKAQLVKDRGAQRKKTPASNQDRRWEALGLCAEGSVSGARDGFGGVPPHVGSGAETLEAIRQKEYMYDSGGTEREWESSLTLFSLYQDQLTLTERHLTGLVDDTNAALKLLTSLSNSFQAVEAQTSSFQSKCEGLLTEQRRLEKLADQVGNDLHYYAYLDTATRRLNAPGASRLVDDEAFGDMVDNIDSCIRFMDSNESYRERDSYLARYNALLTKALHLLDHAFTGRLEKVLSELGRQIVATKSESARHALAYGRFEELMTDSYSLLPNIRRAIRCAYDPYGRTVKASCVSGVYLISAANMFRTYFTTRDRDLKPITQHHIDDFHNEIKSLSVETACRNYIKHSFEKMYNEDGVFSRVFNIEPMWNSSADSAFQAIKAINTFMAHPGNLTPLATSLQAVMETAGIQVMCNVVGWLASEYSISESDDEESPSFRRYREYAARLLVEHLWSFTDCAFIAEVTKSISKAPMQDSALKIEPGVDGATSASASAYPLVSRAMKLLAMFNQAMPKERSAKNSSVVFHIVRETIQVLQRAEARIRTLKTGTDADLFMIQNLLIIKNELLSLEIGDIRSQPQSMQHFRQIWETLSPQNWVGFFSSIIGGSLWTRGAPTVTATTLTAEDMSEQLDELLRQSIYAFTKRWGTLINDSQSRKMGVKPLAEVEAELESILANAFHNHPEVISRLKEAIRLNAHAQSNAQDAKRGAKQY